MRDITEPRYAFLFDIDGTLLLDGGACARAFDNAFSELFGLHERPTVDVSGRTEFSIVQDVALLGLGRELTAEELAALEAAVTSAYPSILGASNTLTVLPGVCALLDALDARGDVVLGIQTGNFEGNARTKLRHAGLASLFRFGGFCEGVRERTALVRRALERSGVVPERVVVLGDTPHDILSARTLGARSVGVATGRYPLEALREAGADTVYESFAMHDERCAAERIFSDLGWASR